MRYLIILLLAGCATDTGVQLRTPDEVECGRQASEFTKLRYPDAEYDDRGIPKMDLFGTAYSAWAISLDRCLKKRGAY
jgi:hypothetical protein